MSHSQATDRRQAYSQAHLAKPDGAKFRLRIEVVGCSRSSSQSLKLYAMWWPAAHTLPDTFVPYVFAALWHRPLPSEPASAP